MERCGFGVGVKEMASWLAQTGDVGRFNLDVGI